MMSDSTVVPLRQPDEVEDPLTAILRSGARRLLAQAVEAEAEAFLADDEGRAAAGRARARGAARPCSGAPGPDRDRPGRGAAGQAARPRRRRWSRAHPLHLGDPAALGAADPEPGCLAAGALPARGLDGRLPGGARERCWARTPRTCRRRRSRGCGASGRRTTRAGSGATCRPGATSMSGPTASTCRRAWSRRPSACWC